MGTSRASLSSSSSSGVGSRNIQNATSSMLYTANLKASIWAKAPCTAVYLINRSLTCALDHMTPYKAWYGSKLDMTHIRTDMSGLPSPTLVSHTNYRQLYAYSSRHQCFNSIDYFTMLKSLAQRSNTNFLNIKNFPRYRIISI